jgi:hypothetical protein
MAPPRATQVKGEQINSGSWEDVPEQFGSRREMLQPGPYRFKLPPLAALQAAIEDLKDLEIKGKPGKHERLVAVLRDDKQAALVITQSPQGERNGEQLSNRLSNVERKRGKVDDPNAPFASDMDYLLQKLGVPTRPRTNQEYRDALLSVAGKEFGADIELGAFCNANKPVRIKFEGEDQLTTMDGQNGTELQNGCGARYYQGKKELPQDEAGKYERSMICNCGATLFLNENLQNFRA